MKKWLGILALIPCLANAQTYSSVSAGTGISISSSGAISNTTPIVSCANNEIVLQNASGSITCDPSLQWSINTATLSLGNGNYSYIQTTSPGTTSPGVGLQISGSVGGSTSGLGGSVILSGGNAQGTTPSSGGTASFYGGYGSPAPTSNGNANGGGVSIAGGMGGGTIGNNTYTGGSTGGAVSIVGGQGGYQTTSGNGGALTLRGGAGSNGGTNIATTNSGAVALSSQNAGSGGTTANAGNVAITGGNGGSSATSSATGASVSITAGNGGASATTNTGGSLNLKSGLGAATANNGSVTLQDGNSNLIAKADGVTDNFVTYYGLADGGIDRLPETTGFSYQIPNNVQTVLIHATGTLATGTLTLPTTPVNGQLIRISADQTITSLTITPSSGQSTAGSYYTGGATLTATAPVSLQYCTTDTEWYVVH